ncbi:flavin reductase family protein [Streptomyces flavofungini]
MTHALQRFAAGITVLTFDAPGGAAGVTVSTLTPVPGTCPMVSVALRRASKSLSELLTAEAFTANALAADQASLAQHFARRRRSRETSQLPPDTWAQAAGIPRLRQATSWLECRVDQTASLRDHVLVIATVTAGIPGSGPPLIGFTGALHADLSGTTTARGSHP